MDSKVCSKCLVEKPASFFSKRADRPCGLHSACKECRKKLPSYAPEKCSERTKQWREKNPDYGKLAQRKARENPAFVANEREREKRKYAADPMAHIAKVKAWQEKNPDRVKANRQASWENNPGSRNAARMKRHAAKLLATPKWADSKRIVKIYEEAKLKSISTGEAWHVDHVIPLQSDLVCGLHVEYNLAVIPKRENLLKSNRLVI